MTKKQMESYERGKTLLWCLIKKREAEENYAKAIREYCLYKCKWDDVEKARRDAHYYGVNDERLLEIDIDIQTSITDEEIMKAVYGN